MTQVTTRASAIGLLVVAAAMLAGCAPEPAPAPTSSLSPTPTASASATPTGAVTPEPVPSASPSGSLSPEPSATTAPPAGEMTAAQAAQLCLEKHQDEPISEGETVTGEPIVFERYLDPRWYVQVPAENEFAELYQECILGGPADDPTWNLIGGVVRDEADDEYVEYQRTYNDVP
ncbi:hypothetical protein [Microbacterium sp.]|uniref:hypothetical protein n=1 Tax=Microbacterium sp. TaxID=51671 RepID=UPI003734E2E4